MSNIETTLHTATGFTLVDITKTDEVSGQADSKVRNQQRNWETLVQVLGLRAQLMSLSSPEFFEDDVGKFRFGNTYSGTHRIWTFQFGIEQDGVYANDVSTFGSLENDFVKVPVILGLDETAEIKLPTFKVVGPQRNIYFQEA